MSFGSTRQGGGEMVGSDIPEDLLARHLPLRSSCLETVTCSEKWEALAFLSACSIC